MVTEPADATLLQRFARQGDREALGTLFERHAAGAYRAAFLVLREPSAAEDVVQEAFVRLIAKAGAYDPGRPFLPWLRTLVTRAAIDRARAEGRRAAREAQAAHPHAPEDPAMQVIDAETKSRLRTELDRLPDELRLPVVLHYQAGCSYAEVAEALGCPEGTVATRLHSARERLKSQLATAGILLASGLSLEEAVAEAAPAAAMPGSLPLTLEALAATASPTPSGHLPPSASFPSRAPLFAAAAFLLAAGIGAGLALRAGASPPIPPGQHPMAVTASSRKPARNLPSPPKSAEQVPPKTEGHPSPEKAAARAGLILGRVPCKETGLPIEGAEVHWSLPHEGGGQRQIEVHPGIDFDDAQTDRDGRFRFDRAPKGSPYRLWVSAPGFAGYESTADHPLFLGTTCQQKGAGEQAWFPALASGEERRHDIALPRGWGIVARLLGSDGSPAREGTLELKGLHEHYRLYFSVETASVHVRSTVYGSVMMDYKLIVHPDGRLELGGLDPERFPPDRSTLGVRVPAFLPVEGIRLGALPFSDGRAHLNLTLEPGRRVEGVVLNPEGLPCGARVLSWPGGIELEEAASKGRFQQAFADAGGHFLLKGLPKEGSLWIWAKGHTDNSNVAMNQPVEVPPGEALTLSLRLDADGEVSGRVLNTEGRPVEDAQVQASFLGNASAFDLIRYAKSDREGRYTLKGLPRWQGLRVSASHPRNPWHCETGCTEVPVGARDLDLTVLDCTRLGLHGEHPEAFRSYPK